ncbi:MAG: hypothetical protein DELT_01679 [Desulfovibrio sp.]
MGQWAWGIAGALFALLGAHKILTGEPGLRGDVPIPAWTGWIQLPFGIWVLFLSIRALWRNRNAPAPPPVNIDEEAARAEAAMDAMYLREHGKLPEKPKKDA